MKNKANHSFLAVVCRLYIISLLSYHPPYIALSKFTLHIYIYRHYIYIVPPTLGFGVLSIHAVICYLAIAIFLFFHRKSLVLISGILWKLVTNALVMYRHINDEGIRKKLTACMVPFNYPVLSSAISSLFSSIRQQIESKFVGVLWALGRGFRWFNLRFCGLCRMYFKQNLHCQHTKMEKKMLATNKEKHACYYYYWLWTYYTIHHIKNLGLSLSHSCRTFLARKNTTSSIIFLFYISSSMGLSIYHSLKRPCVICHSEAYHKNLSYRWSRPTLFLLFCSILQNAWVSRLFVDDFFALLCLLSLCWSYFKPFPFWPIDKNMV